MRPPLNPVTGKNKVVAPGQATPDARWTYDPKTGMVKAVLPKQLESQVRGDVNPRDAEFVGAN